MTATISGAATDQRLLCSAIQRHGAVRIIERCMTIARSHEREGFSTFTEAAQVAVELLIAEERNREAEG